LIAPDVYRQGFFYAFAYCQLPTPANYRGCLLFFCPFPSPLPPVTWQKKTMAATIRRNLALKEYDIKELPTGKQPVFSIKFIKNNGELVFMPRAVACGLNANMKSNRLRGFIPVDANNEGIGHPTPVNIDAIIEWNGKKVQL